MSIILATDYHHADIPDVFSKNANNAASVRVLCAGCKLFLGVLGQFHPLNDPAYPSVKGHRLTICEELRVFTIEQTVNWLRRTRRNPNLADRKGCGQIMVFNANGQLVKSSAKGSEGYDALKKAHDTLKKKKEEAEKLKAWREKAGEMMDRFQTAANPKIWSRCSKKKNPGVAVNDPGRDRKVSSDEPKN